MNRTLTAVALGLMLLSAGGCGEASKPSTTFKAATAKSTTSPAPAASVSTAEVALGKPLTRAQWIAKGDSICAHLNTQLDTVKVRSTADFARVLPQAALYERAELLQLAKLVPPVSKRNDWQAILTGTRRWAENSAKLGQVASQSRNATLITLPLAKTTRAEHEHLARIAKRDGFRQCSII